MNHEHSAASQDPVRRNVDKGSLVAALQQILPPDSVLFEKEDLSPYECDGLSAYRQLPLVVVIPGSIEEVQQIMRLCHSRKVPVVARGTGTGLSGGALPLAEGVVLSLSLIHI